LAVVLVAGAALKGTLDCRAATRALATGVRRAGHVPVALPIADGGDGSLLALGAAGFRLRRAETHDALGRPVQGQIAFRTRDRVAAVEFAEAAGLWRVEGGAYDPWTCTSYGVGELLLSARRLKPARILLLLGGSATQDGGLGLLQALGARLQPSPQGRFATARDLQCLADVDFGPLRARLGDTAFEAAHDVDHLLSGPHGSARSFALQKGFPPQDLAPLDDALRRYGSVLHRVTGLDPEVAGAGAAGGAGAAARAAGARLRPGADCIFDLLGLEAALAGADAVLTSEGQVDTSTWSGKAPGKVATLAAGLGKPAAIVCGRSRATPPPGVWVEAARDRAAAGPADLARAAERALAHILPGA